MGYTLGRAAEATGKTKGAISKAIQKGRISANKNEDGSYDIDPAELHRVYEPVAIQHHDPPSNGIHQETESLLKIRELETKLEAGEQEKKLLHEQIADLRADRDEWREQAKKQTLLLTAAKTEETLRSRGGFWRWLTGRPTA